MGYIRHLTKAGRRKLCGHETISTTDKMFRLQIETFFLRVLTSIIVLSGFKINISFGYSIGNGIARIYSPCSGLRHTDNGTGDYDQSSSTDLFPIYAVVPEFRLVVLETMDLLDFLLDIFVLSDCTNSTTNGNTHVRLTNCRVYDSLISYNLSDIHEQMDYPELLPKEELIDFTGDISLVILLTDLLKMNEGGEPFESSYDTIYQQLMTIYCVLSDVWDGRERRVLDSVIEFYHTVNAHITRRHRIEDQFFVMMILREHLFQLAESLRTFYEDLEASHVPIHLQTK